MAQDGFKRKLTAILIADVVEYNQLTRDDDDATVYDLTIPLSLIVVVIQQHNGRVSDYPDDTIPAKAGCVMDTIKYPV
jgi:class 3 adenylate cyclase